MAASLHGHGEGVKVMLGKGANLEVQDKQGF